MKKTIFSVCAALLSLTAMSQSVQPGHVDPFTKKWVITSGEVRVTKTGFNQQNSFSLSYFSYNDTIQLIMTGTFDKHFTIYKGDRLVFLLDNDSTISLSCPLNQSTYEAVSVTNGGGNSLYDLDAVYLIDTVRIKALMKHTIKTIRLYYNSGLEWVDNDSKGNLYSDYVQLCREFLWEYNRNKYRWEGK